MRGFKLLARGVGMSALLAVATLPAHAESVGDRAKQAIAEAHGKIDAAVKAGTGGDAPGLTARAAQTLRIAEGNYAAGDKEAALLTAMQASREADRAIGTANVTRAEDQAVRQADADAATSVAVAAQQDAAAANARATAAEQSAALANAQADAIRNAPISAPTSTTSTQRIASSVPGQKHVVKQTTTVTPGPGLTEQKRVTTTVTTTPSGG